MPTATSSLFPNSDANQLSPVRSQENAPRIQSQTSPITPLSVIDSNVARSSQAPLHPYGNPRRPSSDLKSDFIRSKRNQSSYNQTFATEVTRPQSHINFSSLTDLRDLKTESLWKRRLDEVRNRVQHRRAYLIDLQDKLEEYSKTNTLVVDEESSNKRIKILENKVDNLMIKFNEAMNIKRMYEGLILSLKQQRTTYDKKIVAMERLGGEKERDVQAASEIYHQAIQKKHLISQKFKDYECRRDETQAQREKYLVSRKQIENEIEFMQRKELRKIVSYEAGLGTEGANRRNSRAKKFSLAPRLVEHETEEASDQIDYNFLEEFFQKVFEITGAKDGGLISQRDHPEVHQPRGKETNPRGTEGPERQSTRSAGGTEDSVAGGDQGLADAAYWQRAGDRR
jgi:hypothetical protein